MSEIKQKLEELGTLINEKTTPADCKMLQKHFKEWSEVLFKKGQFGSFDVNCTCSCGKFTQRIEECSFCGSEEITINDIEFTP